MRDKETENQFSGLEIDWVGVGIKLIFVVMTLSIAFMIYSTINEGVAAEKAHDQALIDQGWHKVEGLNAMYSCPNDNWTGYPGVMTHYETGVFSVPHFTCPECGYEFSEVTGKMVWVNAEGVYQERA